MKDVDILWLVEHVARELDVACAVKSIAENKYYTNIEIRNFYLHKSQTIRKLNPKVIAHPFFYYVKGAQGTEEYIKAWPNAVHVNLAWEEIFYNGIKDIKKPSDIFTKKKVFHHAWGNFYKQYLLDNGVIENNIFLNGNPVYQLYLNPYKKYFISRQSLVDKYQLNNKTKWVFIPENYRWAFLSDSSIITRVKQGGNYEEMLKMREYCRNSLQILFQWCQKAANKLPISIIFRPKPATPLEQMIDFYKKSVGVIPGNIRFIKGESVREWILASDIIYSSFSTTLIESAVAGKSSFMVEPIEIPGEFANEWYLYIQRISSYDRFIESMNVGDSASIQLKQWAMSEMLANGDPIEGLACYLCNLANSKNWMKQKKNEIKKNQMSSYGLSNLFRHDYQIDSSMKNNITHENDAFRKNDIAKRVSQWNTILQFGK